MYLPSTPPLLHPESTLPAILAPKGNRKHTQGGHNNAREASQRGSRGRGWCSGLFASACAANIIAVSQTPFRRRSVRARAHCVWRDSCHIPTQAGAAPGGAQCKKHGSDPQCMYPWR